MIFGDSGYLEIEKREDNVAIRAVWHVAMRLCRAIKNKAIRKIIYRFKKLKASVHIKVGHPFRIIKYLFCYRKARYKVLEKHRSSRDAVCID